jgi:hypothetical protein
VGSFTCGDRASYRRRDNSLITYEHPPHGERLELTAALPR